MIHVVYKGRALPLTWVVRRGKKGHFPEELQIALIAQVQELIPPGAQVVVLGDGEFDGTGFQHTLQEAGWSYVVRTGSNITVAWDGDTFRCETVGACSKPGTLVELRDVRVTEAAYGPIMLLCCWAKGYKDPLYLITNIAAADEACCWYAKRFRIETFFADQKSRGFHLHKSHTLIGSRALSQLQPGSIGIMWLLKSHWSNPMKHLIPYLQDSRKAADYLRQLRWPDGVKCPRCGSDAVEPRERCDNGLQRFNCGHCARRWGQQFATFTDWTSSIFEESKLSPPEWLLGIGLWQLKLNATEIAAAPDIQERTAQRCINLLDGGIFETYHLDPTRQLEHQVEADECYQSAGSKGRPREIERRDCAPRQRGMQLRGRATAATGRPPMLGLMQRRDKVAPDAPAAQVYLEVLEHGRSATITPSIAAKVKSGAQFFTDEYNIYHFTKADYDHRTVNHGAGEYARRDSDGTCVHCNTMEGIWASLRNF